MLLARMPSSVAMVASNINKMAFSSARNTSDAGQRSERASGPVVVKKVEKDPMLADINRRIIKAFDSFDKDANQTVDVREVGNVIRSLGCYPSEADIHDVIQEVEEDDPTEFIRLEKFQPIMARLLIEKRFQPASEDKLMRAFQVLDEENKSYLTKEQLTQYLMHEGGEPFSPDEVDETMMVAVATDMYKDQEVIYYNNFVKLMLDPEHEIT